MNEYGTKLSEKIKVFRMIRTSAIIRNPLLLEAIGLCPVVAIAKSLKSALFLAVVTAVELIICETLASKFLKKMKRYWRVAVYFCVGTAVVLPIMYLVNHFLPSISLEFGVFLPLMAVNSLLALHCERVAVKRNVRDSFLDSVSVSVSYGAVTVITGLLREILGGGTVYGVDLHLPVKFPVMLMPFGGLLLLGFSAAVLKSYIYKKYPQSSPDRAFDTSEVRQSLRGSLRELMNDDFNPYDEGDDAAISADADSVRERSVPKRSKPIPEKRKKKNPKIKSKKEIEIKNTEDTKKRRQPESTERTYLDDFSDILSDLESYKAKEKTNESEDKE